MKDDLERKAELGGDHLVPLTRQAIAVLRALWPLTGGGSLLFPSNRHGIGRSARTPSAICSTAPATTANMSRMVSERRFRRS
jgi:integrase